MTLVATKPLALGDSAFSPTDTIPESLIDALPAGRIEQLKAQRYLREVTSGSELSKRVAELEARVDRLDARQPRRGRPPKAASRSTFDTADLGGQ